MSIWWCAGCGMEDTRDHKACPSCGSALQFSQTQWLEVGSRGDETVYELEVEPIQRAAVVHALHAENVAHRWERAADLVVADEDEPAVDDILDEILGEVDFEDTPEDDDEDDGTDSEVDGEDSYQVMSTLYLATREVLKKWEDSDVSNFIFSTGVALATPTPFGMDDEVWAEVQSQARNAAAALETDGEADVEEQLQQLAELLQTLV